jgi:hypothetical protein
VYKQKENYETEEKEERKEVCGIRKKAKTREKN